MNIPIWPGSSSFQPGDTPFGFYDNDIQFQQDADKFAKFAAQRLGYPLTEIEPMDVAVCMALVKLARTMESKSNYDNYLDAVSYWAIAGSMAVRDWDDLDA